MTMIFGAFVGILLMVAIGALYFLPMIIALAKRKNNKALIICLNIFLGWTLAGWIVSLVLACKKEEK
ncbi:MAG: superinfection immunity protein [Ruminococcaceae bacterium]|nr:superinfection immunity protein [Oscillospiraceae bacterium]